MFDIKSVKPPLTNVQYEILKAFSFDLSDEETEQLTNLISHFLMDKIRKDVDQVWMEKGYDETTIQKWLNED